jgi:hypothetical protein
MLLHDFHHLVGVFFPKRIGDREAVGRALDYDLVQFRFLARI